MEYESATIHTLDELADALSKHREEHNLVYDIKATIPFSKVGLSFNPTRDDQIETVKGIINFMNKVSGHEYVYNTYSKGAIFVTRATFLCNQDIASKDSTTNSSLLKVFDCKYSFIF